MYCSVDGYDTCSNAVFSALTQTHNHFSTHLFIKFIAMSLIRCSSKSAQKFDVQVCQVATVVMETTQLVLSQFKNFLS